MRDLADLDQSGIRFHSADNIVNQKLLLRVTHQAKRGFGLRIRIGILAVVVVADSSRAGREWK